MCGGLFSFCFLHETVIGNGNVAITHNYCIGATHLRNTNKINMETLYTITYSNHFAIENRTFAFRKKMLFDITDTPKFLELKIIQEAMGTGLTVSGTH